MTHLDEGTIHAWLDGALDAERGRDVETHVAACAECSAAVAEARGLIAGASRILTALDDVPANVTPKRGPSAPSTPAPRRQWRAAPWVTGIAAALILAVGVTTWNKSGARMESEMVAATPMPDSSARETAQSLAAAVPPAAVSTPAPAAGTAPAVTEPSAANVAVAQRREAAKLEQKSAPQRAADVATGRAAGVAAERDFSGAADSAEVRRRQVGSIAVRGTATDTTRLRTTSGARVGLLSEVVVTAAPSGVDSTAAAVAVSGCYRIASAEERASEAKSLTKQAVEAAAGAAASSRAAKPAAPSAPAVQLRDRSDFAGQRPAIVRLDTTRAGVGLRVNDAQSSSYLGTWQRVGDSVRVNLFVHGVFTIAARDSVNCP
jgi:hypothetical protein